MKATIAIGNERRLTGAQQRMADGLAESLSAEPRRIPPIFFYDALGSALFGAICELPWYNVTRSEMALLAAHAGEIGRIATPRRLVELGPGDGRKAAALARGLGRASLEVHMVDISPSALAAATATVSAAGVRRVTSHVGTYEAGLAAVGGPQAGAVTPVREPPFPSHAAGPMLVAFLGSNIGNFEPHEAHEFLARVRSSMSAGDWLLVGADLVKRESVMLAAYDDPLGVTAAFNKNVLQHINRELGADFDLDAFVHLATWRRHLARVEMHLVSRRRQTVTVTEGLTLTLQRGETIRTECSHKYEPETIVSLVEPTGFERRAQWVDERYRFALTLFAAI